ncbi:MAG: 5-deoxy-glucuronate isomerase [Ruminococcaceae bacterium]|jgi:5-deoxy-glucuronate isomerase|nr:5-deoxy-glucuronate isomerase [Oscillospiraceae bacterium]
MYERPSFNENNEKILCLRNGKNADMLMDIRVKILKAGEKLTLCDKEQETAVLLMQGEVEFVFDGKTETASRRSPFLDKATAIHFSKGLTVEIKAASDSRLVIEQTDNENDFGYHYYTPDMLMIQHFGADQWDGTADRQVLTVFDYESAPYSNLVLGEVFHKPGCWTSYPPHYHPQPEVYYYEFEKPQGFGVGFNGDDCYKVEDGGCLCITPMHTHQQAAAPGYKMCYVWMIRHLENDPWRKTRIDAPEHKWLLDL